MQTHAGGPLPLGPEQDQVPELLEQLVTQRPRCLYCPDPIQSGDMFVAWPILGIIAHFACYAQAQRLVRVSQPEASS